uniref:Class II aldolase/adducin N-terminal domain-containing protein n=1 Tax=Parascaris univalens TaxID=6257 RepID=A0A915BBA1_PARUN
SNGAPERSFINFDPDDPEYIKDLQRPAAIKEDLSEMERRKRVQQILESKSFCKELEELIRQESENNKSDPEHLKTLQRLSELTLPHGHLAAASLRNIGSANVLPIADLRGNDKYSKAEKMLRNRLASLYRLVDLFQWSQGIYNHITLRLSHDSDEVLINPFGLLYHEITAASLIKVNLDGEILDHGSTKLGINQAGYVLHSAIHKARPDVRCVLHMHTAVVSAVSSMKCGLLPICQEAMIIGPVAYHDYQGILDEESERESIIEDLGDRNVLLLRNHGFVTCGESVEDALHLAFHTIIACDTQLRAARAGLENLVIPDEKAVERAYKTARRGGGGVSRSPAKDACGRQINWRIGELEWEAWMRVLDNAGYRTGHLYRQPVLRAGAAASASTANQNDVAVPPSASAMGEVDESDAEALTAHKIALMRKEQERSRWLNSPNAYQRIEILETGTDNPKKITKWVQDVNTPSHSGTAMKINWPHQFSPFAANPKEFKEKQKAIKETRRLGATSAGPQSQILDGVTYEEAAQMRAEAEMSGQGDRVVMIGTASKGIIDRQHQHNAQVYRQLYAPNPFACETDEDIQKYMKEVESKTPRPGSATEATERGTPPSPPIYETDSPSAETVSLMQAAREHRSRPPAAAMASASVDEESGDKTLEQQPNATQAATANVGCLIRETTFDESDIPQSRLVRGSPLAASTPHREMYCGHWSTTV